MRLTSIIGGSNIATDVFKVKSIFYKYEYEVANTKDMEISRAIGNTKKAAILTLANRIDALHKTAKLFKCTQDDIEHTVKMTGMPVSILNDYAQDIPNLFTSIPSLYNQRFPKTTDYQICSEHIGSGIYKTFSPLEGFCYAVTPGNDPRAVAFVATNLCYFGVPFIIKASKEDAMATDVIRALIEGGFDPNFCNLVYFNTSDADAGRKHFKLVDASSLVWTFGSDDTVDNTLRYEQKGKRGIISIDPNDLPTILSDPNRLKSALVMQYEIKDHFVGKNVLRHGSGNCASITQGQFDNNIGELLYKSTGYAIGCTATKSVMAIESTNWAKDAADYLLQLKVGDPLDPDTKIGFVHPDNLNYIFEKIKANNIKTFYGGRRIHPHQAEPVIIQSQEHLPEFFGVEVSAYVLAVRYCGTVAEAIEHVNKYATAHPRLAVSLLHLKEDDIRLASSINTHTVLFNHPTANLVPIIHEGNDYALRIMEPKVVIKSAEMGLIK